MSKDRYESPLASRYASEFMLHLFSPDMRFQTWRRLWVALARAEHNLGLPISAEQVAELEAHVTDIDYETAAAREKEVRHDVMAHVYTYGKAAPSAAGIIHLGATSCYVTDNADLILYREGLRYLRGELLAVVANLAKFADTYKATPTLGYTHYQPAQLVTVGKRATLWMQDLLADLEELDFVIGSVHNRSLAAGGDDFYYGDYHSPGACYQALDDYVSSLERLASAGAYDVLGHIIYPLRYMARGCPEVSMDRYADRIRVALAIAIASGRGMELNTYNGRTLAEWRPWLALYRELGGEILTVGSDAHVPENVGQGVPEAYDLIRAAGFRYIAVYEGRKPRFVKL